MSSITGKGASPAGQTTTTQTTAPYMYPYIGTALQQAGDLYGSGGPQYYPGQQLAGFSDPQQAAMGNIDQMANGGWFNGANRLMGNLENGNFGAVSPADSNLEAMGAGGTTNPYLDAMYKQAAGQTQGQLAGEFAGMGRNAVSAAPLRSEQLNNLATSLYGGTYDANQNRALQANNILGNQQLSALQMNPMLNAAEMGNQQAELGVGGMVQNLAQQEINANQQKYNYYQQLPYQQLQQYEQFLQGIQPGMQQIAPSGINPTANALNMALMAQKLYSGYQGKGGSPSAGTSSPAWDIGSSNGSIFSPSDANILYDPSLG